jgi:hypothetical protein
MSTTTSSSARTADRDPAVTTEDAPLADGQVRVRVDAFALTSNNITYAAFGDAMSYWQFFPAGEEGWGIVPVWGFGRVVQSLHPGVAVGERLYGYWPMASSAVLQPERLSRRPASPTPRRTARACTRSTTSTCAATATRSTPPTPRARRRLLRPLFITSWLIDDFLADNDFFGASVMLLSSASSKTAYGTAFQLAQRRALRWWA